MAKHVTHARFAKIAEEARATQIFTRNRQRDWPKISQANWRISKKLMFTITYSQGTVEFKISGDLGVGFQSLTSEELKQIEMTAHMMLLIKEACSDV